MKKQLGSTIVELFDKRSAKVNEFIEENYIKAHKTSIEWEKKEKGNKAVIYRIMYNTECANNKWSYKNE